jgi:hypothetical protein
MLVFAQGSKNIGGNKSNNGLAILVSELQLVKCNSQFQEFLFKKKTTQ